MRPDPVTIEVSDRLAVSGLMITPDRAVACCVLAHGAGAGMTHPFMVTVADGLSMRRIATLRYQFPYMERGSARPDVPSLAHATVRAAARAAASLVPDLPLIAGGKSFGGRMTSQAQAESPLAGVKGLVFLGFPLHPARKPAVERAAHLSRIAIPMLFLQGSRDALADISLLASIVQQLGAAIEIIEDADHSFLVPAKAGRTSQEAMDQVLDGVADWVTTLNP